MAAWRRWRPCNRPRLTPVRALVNGCASSICSDLPRLAEGLRVAPGWELAVETVLGADLHAVLLDDYQGLEFSPV
jgi:chromosome segregation ATPase